MIEWGGLCRWWVWSFLPACLPAYSCTHLLLSRQLWHAAWEARLRAKAEQEQQVARAAQAQAARDLDAFYDRATDSKALR